jgi:ABC-type transport system substrate-binding protein
MLMAGPWIKRGVLLLAFGAACLGGEGQAAPRPEGELTHAMYATLAPARFDPGLNTGIISPKIVQDGLHDALFKPMPEGCMTPSLAESYTEGADKIESFFIGSGTYAYVDHPDIGELSRKQDVETDVSKREAMLLDIQRLAYERALFVPLYAWVWHTGVGPRVGEASLGKIPFFYYTGPFEDMRLKGK